MEPDAVVALASDFDASFVAPERDIPGIPQLRAFLRESVRGPDERRPVATFDEGKWTVHGTEPVDHESRG